jgi:hypothetical protein
LRRLQGKVCLDRVFAFQSRAEVQPDDVPDDDRDDLQRVKTATCYDLVNLRAMGRLWSQALWWRLRRLQSEIGRPPIDPS